jgi:hypothetical protein
VDEEDGVVDDTDSVVGGKGCMDEGVVVDVLVRVVDVFVRVVEVVEFVYIVDSVDCVLGSLFSIFKI